MIQDYRARRARPARRRAALRAATATSLVLALVAAACGAGSPPAPSVSDAFEVAHPTPGVPGTLRTVDLSRDDVAGRVARIVKAGTRIVLPAWLPPSYAPAAPYIAVGDGSARPNPEGWGRSYRVSYTDGRGLLVMTVGAEETPDGVSWSGRHLLVDGRPARAGRAGNAVVVTTTAGRPPIVITGRLLGVRAVLRTARSLSPAP